MIDLDRVIRYAEEKHKGQKRKNGQEYIIHPLRVAQRLQDAECDDNTVVAGVFHDLLEDTDATEEEILALTNQTVLDAVKLVTKSKNVSSKEYINKILENPIAKAVKNADRIDNLVDAQMSANRDFIKRYLQNTKEYYVGKFSNELDEEYKKLLEIADATFEYILDGSFHKADSPVFRKIKDGKRAWVFNTTRREWVETDPYFWVELGDDATSISEEEAYKLIGPYLK